jgi:hypothetical protein
MHVKCIHIGMHVVYHLQQDCGGIAGFASRGRLTTGRGLTTPRPGIRRGTLVRQ